MQGTFIGKFASVVLTLVLTGLSPASADSQQDYCIQCTSPNETYICRITSASGQTQGKQFLCIVNIAREHGHDSCSVSVASNRCSGVLVQYEVSGTPRPQVPLDTATDAVSPTPDETTETTKKSTEPKTLVEFTKQATTATKKSLQSAGKGTQKAISKTGKAIENTGSNIKDFTDKVGSNIKSASKTTWRCMTSLFFNCGGD